MTSAQRALALHLLAFGLRPGEIVALTFDDFPAPGGRAPADCLVVECRAQHARRPERRLFALPAPLAAELVAFAREWPRMWRGERPFGFSTRHLANLFHAARVRAGVRYVRPYALRSLGRGTRRPASGDPEIRKSDRPSAYCDV